MSVVSTNEPSASNRESSTGNQEPSAISRESSAGNQEPSAINSGPSAIGQSATVTREETQAKLDRHAAAAGTHTPESRYTLADRFEERAIDSTDKTMVIYQGQTLSYGECNRRANQVAHAAIDLGIKAGDVAALMMENRPEFFITYVGLAKLGAKISLINTNARGDALQHALATTGASSLFLGAECIEQASSVEGLFSSLPSQVIQDGDNVFKLPANSQDLGAKLTNYPVNNPAKSLRDGITASEELFFVFTSGTTGLPKAARMSHMRWLNTGEFNASVLDVSPDDTFYCFLPLHHGAAGMSLASTAFSRGACIMLRRRFSTRNFWREVREHKVTIAQYIGEICRYLITQPAQAEDAVNPLKKIIGAGLSPSVWQEFQKRFDVASVFEGWGATEANSGIINVDNKLGSVGRIPFKEKSNARLIKYDMDNNEHVRDADGNLLECQAGEVGELIGKILNIPGVAAGRFEGYTDVQATEKKILRNVFQPGDAWFSSGDLLRVDEDDYYYFVDRIGDTFRWKSENVSTTEVSDALSRYQAIDSLNIYGVAVPEQEGRAGMASIVMRPGLSFDPAAFFAYCQQHLPKYAVPVFVRVSDKAELTATFKLRKVDLQKQGYTPELVKEPLFVCDEKLQSYVQVTDATLKQLGYQPFKPST